MARIYDVAEYILEKLEHTSPDKMHILAYYCQVRHFTWTKTYLFEDNIKILPLGPFVEKISHYTQGESQLSPQTFPGDADGLSDDEKKSMDVVLRSYGDLSELELLDIFYDDNSGLKYSGFIAGGIGGYLLDLDAAYEFYYKRQKRHRGRV